MKRRSAATTLRVLTNSYNLKYNYYKIRQMEELPRLFVRLRVCLCHVGVRQGQRNFAILMEPRAPTSVTMVCSW